MNDITATLLAQHLINLPFLTQTTGLVQELSLKVPNGTKTAKVKKIPAARVEYRKPVSGGGSFNGSFNLSFNTGGGVVTNVCPHNGTYYDFIPKTAETGILYFEDGGSKLIKSDTRKAEYTGTLTLVCWLNMKLIGDNYKIGDFINAVAAQIPLHLAQSNFVIGGSVVVDQVLPNRPSPFNKYDYDEAEKQYITYPFDYFAMKLNTKIIINRLCTTSIVLDPLQC